MFAAALAFILSAPPALAPIKVAYPKLVDINGDGARAPVSVEYSRRSEDYADAVTLKVGEHTFALTPSVTPSRASKFTAKTIAVHVIDDDPKAPGETLLVSQDITGSHEYTSRMDLDYGRQKHRLIGWRDGKLATLWEHVTYDKVARPKGRGGWLLDDYECIKRAVQADWEEDKTVVKWGRERRTTYRYTWDGERVARALVRKATRRSFCGGQRFCPFVYVGAPEVKIGEILRNQVGEAAWRDDALDVPQSAVVDGVLTVRLAEEKLDETTHLDGVWLQVGEARIAPDACDHAGCVVDGETLKMPHGASLTLTFSGVPAGPVRLWANGYYLLN